VSDRFGDYGLVGVLIVQQRVQELFVDTFLLSCRALGRGVEHRMLSALAEEAQDHGIYTVSVLARRSAKNAPALQFLDSVLNGTGQRLDTEDGILYRYPVAALQSLRWKPGRNGKSAPAKPRPSSASSRAFTAFDRIARSLRTPLQVVAALRKQSHAAQVELAGLAEPVTETQQRLARIWTELLERPVRTVSDNFFDLGGHSLLAVLLLMRVKEEFAVELSVDDVYSGALTLESLAETIEARQLGEIAPEEYQALLAEIEGLSDEEVRALLDQAGPDDARSL